MIKFANLRTLIIISTLLFLSAPMGVMGQGKIKLKKAKKLKSGTYHGKKVNRVLGDVKFVHGRTTMYCDSAYQYIKGNTVDAWGHIKIVQSDGVTIFGDSLNYNGNTKFAKMRGRVKLLDRGMTLTTKRMDYNMKTRHAHYYNGGRIVDDETTLTSEEGIYDLANKTYYFRKDVVMDRKGYHLVCDTLNYNTLTKYSDFFGPTYITTGDKNLYAEGGRYHTVKEESYFKKNAKIETPTFQLTGDSIYYDNNTDIGHATGNVELASLKDSLIVFGDQASRWGQKFESVVTGKPLMRKIDSGDTLYLRADTLVSKNDTVTGEEWIQAYRNVRFFRHDIQGVCDSLFYDLSDSVIHFNKTPVLWNGLNQITADTIFLTMRNRKIDRLFANVNAFIVSQEQQTRFNQVKGRHLVAFFENESIDHVDINGNGESVYYASDDDTGDLIGMNKVICSNMVVGFFENAVDQITFLTQPDANFIPPHMIQPGASQLKNFSWKLDSKPTRQTLTSRN